MIYAFSDTEQAIHEWAAAQSLSMDGVVALTSPRKIGSMSLRSISETHFVGEYDKNPHYEWFKALYDKAHEQVAVKVAELAPAPDKPVVVPFRFDPAQEYRGYAEDEDRDIATKDAHADARKYVPEEYWHRVRFLAEDWDYGHRTRVTWVYTP